MKGLILFFAISIFVIPVGLAYSPNSTGVLSQNDEIRLSIERYDPSPVQPGEYFDIWVRVQLMYSKTQKRQINDFKIELNEKFPFYLDRREDKVKEFGILKEGQIIVFKYRIKVDENAPEGKNDLRFSYSPFSSKVIDLPPLAVDVGTRDAILVIDNIKTNPERLSAGFPSDLKFILSNPTKSRFRNINLKLNLFDTPFTALNSIPEKIIYSLDAGQKTELDFSIITDIDAKSRVYKVPIELEYEDRLGKLYKQNNSIALLINSPIGLQVDIESTDILKSKSSGEVVFSIANVESSDIKFLSVKVMESKDYEIVSSDRVYVGSIESDDFETVEFDLYVNPTREKEAKIKLLLEYKNAFNEESNKIVEVPLKLYSKREAINYGLLEPTTGFRTLVLFLLIALLMWKLYRNYRKTKSLSHAFKLTYRGFILLLRNILSSIFRFFMMKKNKKND